MLSPPELLPLSPIITEREMLRSMGIAPGQTVKKRLLRYIAEALPVVAEHARPRLIQRIGEVESLLDAFTPFARLRSFLGDADYGVLMVGTAGRELESLAAAEPNRMKAYLYGVAATALARGTLVQAREALSRRFATEWITTTASPGTGGMPFMLQRDVAQLLPLERVGIEFDNESMMMTPLASVSAIIRLKRTLHQVAPRVMTDPLDHCWECGDPGCSLRVC